jgi:hypothetical protein
VATVLCVVLGWKVRQVQRQKAAVAMVEARAGAVIYDYEDDESYDGRLPGPDWLCVLIGVDYFATVSVVAFQKYKDISSLADLTKLEHLLLCNAEQSDLKIVANLTNLKTLALDNGEFTDVSLLANLSELEELQLIDIKIADKEVAKLQKALPHCAISRRETSGGGMPGFVPLSMMDEAEVRAIYNRWRSVLEPDTSDARQQEPGSVE